MEEKIKEILNSDDKIKTFSKFPNNIKGKLLLELPKKTAKDILENLKDEEILKIISYLDPDEITDVLQVLEEGRREKIIEELDENIKKKVTFLLKFDPKTAAGIMDLDYILINKNENFEKLIKLIEKHEKRRGKVPAILVVDDNNYLIGEIQPHSIAIADKKEPIEKYIKRVPSVKYDESENEVINVFRKNPHNKIVVLDEDKSILGIIYSDDILKLIRRKSFENLRSFAGIKKEEDVFDSALTKVKNRYKWLIINLFTAFLAALVVSLFQETISVYTLLAVYMPVVAGMGGNAGTQTLAVIIRGLALGEIDLKTCKRVIKNEMIAGAINGAINGAIAAFVCILFNKNPLLGLIIALAMIINLIIAGFFGGIIPLILKSLGKDPASSATIFITTATDVFGFLSFLGLASLILK